MNEQNLIHFPRSDKTSEPLAPKPTQVRLPETIALAIDAMGKDKTPWLRRVITEAAQRELLRELKP